MFHFSVQSFGFSQKNAPKINLLKDDPIPLKVMKRMAAANAGSQIRMRN